MIKPFVPVTLTSIRQLSTYAIAARITRMRDVQAIRFMQRNIDQMPASSQLAIKNCENAWNNRYGLTPLPLPK